jgi:hypothetical protein
MKATFSSRHLVLAWFVIAALDSLAAQPEAGKRSLPVSELILYSSGVGYFQRDGRVEGQTAIDLAFKVDDINDLLKSLVVQDLDGGQVSTVTYGSRDPLTKTLKSFGIDLTSNPTLGKLLDQVRGEQVEVLRPSPLQGTILGVEKKTETLDDKRTLESEYLNLLTDDGLQSLPLSQLQRIKLLNSRLNTELHQALQVLAAGHDTQKKTVAITFDGQGTRRVSVAYIAQTPVWKTSYRLVLDEKEKPYLQGWAIVENTSDDDWQNVKLSLVSGRPISFTMDLYQPLYTTRPEVEPELYTSLRPQVYGQGIDASTGQPLPAGEAEGVVDSNRPAQLMDRYRMDPRLAARYGLAAGPRSAGGFGGGGIGGGIGAQGGTAPTTAKSMNLAGRGLAEEGKREQTEAALLGLQNINAAAQGNEAGELFEYVIDTPVSLPRQTSAMLPIVSDHVEGEKLSIYNERVQAKYPLNGFRLKNTTALHLMQGPITVFDANAYAGDARMEDLAPGQERLISYALDLKTEVEPQTKAEPQQLLAVKIRKGTLDITRRAGEEKLYLVRNRDQKKKRVLVEHPFRADWQLVEPKTPNERTRDVYRFLVAVAPDQTAKLEVREQKQLNETVELLNTGPDMIAYYLKAKEVGPKVKAALEKVMTLRDRLSKTTAEKSRREQRVSEISQEQGRIRENMARLSQSSELYSRYVKKLDQQETELDNLRKEIEGLKLDEAKQQNDLNEYVLNLDLE